MIAALALALLIDIVVGYPATLLRAIGHPVTWTGALVDTLDRHLNQDAARDATRRACGVLALLVVVGVAVAAGLAIQALAHIAPPLASIIVIAIVASTGIAARSLHEHVRAVAGALDCGGLEAGRRAVAHIVGRDPQALDEAGLCRAAIESLAENHSDGVVAPAFWFALAGLPGIAAYKAINTADSMIGHRTPRHRAFGWAAARLDDLVNLPASRLTALLLIAAAALLPGCDAASAWRAVWRDAAHHRSPNAGWPEAAMAGALGLRLAGPRVYGGTRVEDRWMGDGRAEATSEDIRRALRLFGVAHGLMTGGGVAVAIGAALA
ncbi:MAG: cobalamin biosynthesis protein CobD [Alphaproteobacteria bacterium]|nr:cobalamin biosynthesis protein CobD [Alphaproteobacteria bacterium]MCW5743017.1 cobalamin biosynthesis protein CobD [Alphaproteobacteria bacterium]